MTEEAVRVAVEEAGVAEPVFDQARPLSPTRKSVRNQPVVPSSKHEVTVFFVFCKYLFYFSPGETAVIVLPAC